MKIEIPNLCHENWNEMTENSCGRFCQFCQKTVHDFTQKTPAEIESFFNQNRGGEVCGRFRSEQLERHYYFTTPTPLWYPVSKIASIILASAMLLTSTSCMGAVDTERTEELSRNSFEEFKDAENHKKIVGKVEDEQGNLLVGVNISLPQLHLMVQSDVGGNYMLVLPKDASGIHTLTASKKGYESYTFKVNQADFRENTLSLQVNIPLKTTKSCTKSDANTSHPDEIKMGKFVPSK